MNAMMMMMMMMMMTIILGFARAVVYGNNCRGSAACSATIVAASHGGTGYSSGAGTRAVPRRSRATLSAMASFTRAHLAREHANLSTLTKLDLSRRALSSIDFDFGDLPALQVLDVSNNRLTNLPSSLQKCKNLTFLNVSNNALTALPELSTLKELRSLLANNNQLSAVPPLSSLIELCGLVLSHNSLIECPDIAGCRELNKLSLSDNRIRTLPATLARNVMLKEIRVNRNELSALPDDLAALVRLKLVDLGNNRFSSCAALLPLQATRALVNLNLKGNHVCERSSYTRDIVTLFPKLEILDNARVPAPTFVPAPLPPAPNARPQRSSAPAVPRAHVAAVANSTTAADSSLDFFTAWPTTSAYFASLPSASTFLSSPSSSTAMVTVSDRHQALGTSRADVRASTVALARSASGSSVAPGRKTAATTTADDSDEPVEVHNADLEAISRPHAAARAPSVRELLKQSRTKQQHSAAALSASGSRIRFDDSDDDGDDAFGAATPAAIATVAAASSMAPSPHVRAPAPAKRRASRDHDEHASLAHTSAAPTPDAEPTRVVPAPAAAKRAKIAVTSSALTVHDVVPKGSIAQSLTAASSASFDAFGAGGGWD